MTDDGMVLEVLPLKVPYCIAHWFNAYITNPVFALLFNCSLKVFYNVYFYIDLYIFLTVQRVSSQCYSKPARHHAELYHVCRADGGLPPHSLVCP